MKQLSKGEFFGSNKIRAQLNGLIVGETLYVNAEGFPWHFHEDAYFTYMLDGNMQEKYRNHTIQASTGSLFYHHFQDAHCNLQYSEKVKGLYVELQSNWFNRFDVKPGLFEGVKVLNGPVLKTLFSNINKESKELDGASLLSIEGLVLQAFGEMTRYRHLEKGTAPNWVSKIKELLHFDYEESLSLEDLAKKVNLHPVYLSSQFPKYFKTTFGDYIRKMKIEKSIILLKNRNLSILDIAYDCGFADQSHFARCFRKIYGITPSHYRKINS